MPRKGRPATLTAHGPCPTGMEVLPSTARGAWSVASHVVFAMGQALLGGVAWVLPYWRWLLRVIYSSALLTLPLMW